MSLVQKASNAIKQLEPYFRGLDRYVGKPVRSILEWVPVTGLGLLVVIPALLVMHKYGGETNDRIILVGGFTIVGIAATCAVSVLLASIWLRFRPENSGAASIDAEVGVPILTGFRLGFCAWNPLLRIELAWDKPYEAQVTMASTKAGLQEEVVARSRGMHDFIPRKMVISDVLGLSRCVVRRHTKTNVFIKPARGRSTRIEIAQQAFTSEQLAHPDGKPQGDLIETRRYSPGDPLKLVMWKVYARTGQLLVRSAERTAASSQKAFAYFVAAEGDEPTASVAQAMLQSGALGTNLIFGSDGSPQVARTELDAIGQVVRSASARDKSGRNLSDFLRRVSAEGLTAGVLFVPSRPGKWLDTVSDALIGRQGSFRAIIGSDGSLDSPARPAGLFQRVLFQKASGQQAQEDIEVVREKLANRGVSVTVVAQGNNR